MLNQENALEMIDFRDYNLKLKFYINLNQQIFYLPPGLVGPKISLIFSIVDTICGLLKQLPLKIKSFEN